MKAFAIHNYGGNEVVKLIEIPKPTLKPTEILVKIKAASVNPVDFKIRDGQLKFVLPYKFPLILGNDCSGVIESIGSQVQKFKVGDEIYSRPDKTKIGTFSEYIATEESAASLKPNNLSFEEAASLPLVGLTCWQAFVEKGKVNSESKVFIPAGSGGVGTFAIQLAKHLGAYVATTTSTRNVDFVKKLGADVVIDYLKEDFSIQLSGFDLALDTLGGENQTKAFSILKPGGKLISILWPPNVAFCREMNLNPFITTIAFFLGYKAMRMAKLRNIQYSLLMMLPNGEQLGQITKLVENNILRPVIDKIFPFQETKEALAYVEKGRARGKVIVRVS